MSHGRTDQESRHLRGLLAAAPWIVMLLGVVVMLVLFVVAVLTLTTERRSPDRAQQPVPALPFPSYPAIPAGSSLDPSVVPTTADASGPAATPTRVAPSGSGPSRSAPRATGRTGPPRAPATVTGRYRVVDSYSNSFTGEVLVSNVSTTDRSWTVLLSFPAGVGSLRTSWVEGARQATVSRDGDRYVFSSAVPIAAGESVALRFQLNDTGGVVQPVECSVNDSSCVIG